MGTNRYAYSFNDPVNFSDPGGNCAEGRGADGCTIEDKKEPSIDETVKTMDADAIVQINGHAMFGDGTAVTIDFSNTSIADLGGSIQKMAGDPNSQLGQAIQKARETGEAVEVTISGIRSGSLFGKNGIQQGLGVGRISLNIDGYASINENGDWVLSGEVTADPDVQDYPKSDRSWVAEMGTKTLGGIQGWAGGKNYVVEFKGSYTIKATPFKYDRRKSRRGF